MLANGRVKTNKIERNGKKKDELKGRASVRNIKKINNISITQIICDIILSLFVTQEQSTNY